MLTQIEYELRKTNITSRIYLDSSVIKSKDVIHFNNTMGLKSVILYFFNIFCQLININTVFFHFKIQSKVNIVKYFLIVKLSLKPNYRNYYVNLQEIQNYIKFRTSKYIQNLRFKYILFSFLFSEEL